MLSAIKKFKQSTISLIWTTLRGGKKSTWNALLAAWKGEIFISLYPFRIIERVKKLSLKFAFKFQVEVRYNVPSTRGESCKFDLNITVKEIKEPRVGNLFGPVEDEAADDNEKGKKNDKGGINRCKKLRGKKAKRKCRKEEKEKQKKRNKNKSNKNKRPPPKHQPVKSIHLKVCTR